MATLGPTHEWRHVHMISEGTFTRNETNFCLCNQFATNLPLRDPAPNNFSNVAMVWISNLT